MEEPSIEPNATVLEDQYDKVYGFVLRRVRNASDAQDLAQEAYSRLLGMETRQFIKQPAAYLYRIASNLTYEYARNKHRTVSLQEFEDIENIDILSSTGTEEALDDQVYNIRLLKHLEKSLKSMPKMYAAVVVLRKRDGMSHNEIAERLDISTHTVHKYLTRAMKICREASEKFK